MSHRFELGTTVKSKRGTIVGKITGRSEYFEQKFRPSYLVEWVDEKQEPREKWFDEWDIEDLPPIR